MIWTSMNVLCRMLINHHKCVCTMSYLIVWLYVSWVNASSFWNTAKSALHNISKISSSSEQLMSGAKMAQMKLLLHLLNWSFLFPCIAYTQKFHIESHARAFHHDDSREWGGKEWNTALIQGHAKKCFMSDIIESLSRQNLHRTNEGYNKH